MIGRTLGNFRIVSKLGDGGMGSVFRATDEMLDREVALKVLKPELARQASLIERFRQEAIALARLNHPRIAALHGMERHGEELVMVMEFLPGETLESIVQRSGRIAWARAAELCMDILEALDHAHDKGVVHRDIKPANAMLTRDGRVKVMDFGIARLKDRNRQTRMGHAVGTPMYMSPEQLRGEEVDGRADLYAVGAVLFELVTGRMAFEADSDYELMMKQLNEPPPSAAALVGDVPAAIDAIIARSMAKRREERFPNAIAMRDALKRALGREGLSATGEIRRPATPAPETRLVGDVLSTTADHPSTSPKRAAPDPLATRLSPQSVEPDSLATRLAPQAAAPATRLAEEAPRISGSHPGAPLHPNWSRDWRTWAAAAALLFSVAVAVRTFGGDQDPTEPSSGDSDVNVATQPLTTDNLNPVADAADTTPRVRPPSATVIPSGTPGPVADDLAPPGGGKSGEVRPTPPPVARERTPPQTAKGGTRDGNQRQTPRDTVRTETPTPPTVVAPVPVPAPPPAEERRADPPPVTTADDERSPVGAVRSAIAEFAGNVGGRNAGAVQSVLRGDDAFTSQFVSLVREGRLQMSLAGEPAVDVNGSRASARFTTSLNVRSPFGANRRRPASFTAELSRSGGDWRVVSIRPSGSIDLK
ncbi:MAG: protein kinase domain-containing protein [Gemmatimonadota bacterium]